MAPLPANGMTTIIENTPQAWDRRASAPASWDAALWSERGQTQRFLAVLNHLELRAGDGLLDYGAGTGRLSEFLPAAVDYYAFDTSAGMRDRCRDEHPRATVLDEPPRIFPYDHVVAVGPFNLADRWSLDDTRAAIQTLWRLTTRTLVVSLYRGHDPACLRYPAALVTQWASELSDRFVVDAHMPNDLLLAAHR